MQRFLGLVNSLNFRPLPHFGIKTAAVLGLLQDLRKGKQGGPSQQAKFVAAVMVNADAHMLQLASRASGKCPEATFPVSIRSLFK